MTRVLIAVSGSDHWTLADGEKHHTGFWPEELVLPHKAFRDAGWEIVVATPGGVRPVPDAVGFAPEYNGGSTEPGEAYRAYLASIDDELAAPVELHSLVADDFDVLFLPGGHGPMEDLARSTQFGSLVSDFDNAGKTVVAVCHGTAALLPALRADGTWVFADRRVTGFSNIEENQIGLAGRAFWLLEDEIVRQGGIYERADEPWASHVAIDGNLYTGQNPGSTEALAATVVQAMSNRAQTAQL